jgi:hypothetical protein
MDLRGLPNNAAMCSTAFHGASRGDLRMVLLYAKCAFVTNKRSLTVASLLVHPSSAIA